jgi:hypothetical protein
MYDFVNQYMKTHGKKLITATHSDRLDVIKHNDDFYKQYGQFLQMANPDRIAYNGYPLRELEQNLSGAGIIRWNSLSEELRWILSRNGLIWSFLIHINTLPESSVKRIHLPEKISIAK